MSIYTAYGGGCTLKKIIQNYMLHRSEQENHCQQTKIVLKTSTCLSVHPHLSRAKRHNVFAYFPVVTRFPPRFY